MSDSAQQDKILYKAAQNGATSKLIDAISQGANVDMTDKEYNFTPLHVAASNGKVDCITELIKAGANLNCRSNFNNTPLSIAITNKNKKCIHALIEAGADINTTNNNGKSPLQIAAEKQMGDIFELLIERGAHIATLSKEQQQKYKTSIQTARKARPYTIVNDHIVEKYEGTLSGGEVLRQIFNFSKRTITEAIDSHPNTAQRFDEFRHNQDDILHAYEWMQKQGYKPAHPFKATAQRLNKRSTSP